MIIALVLLGGVAFGAYLLAIAAYAHDKAWRIERDDFTKDGLVFKRRPPAMRKGRHE